MFLQQYPALMAEIEQAIAGQQAPGLMRAAHTLKGSAQVIGGEAVAATALRLEQIGRDEQLDQAAAALDPLLSAVVELRDALQSLVSRSVRSESTTP